jgi:sugar/nucleoside kinase (ribokinase family)
MKKYDVCGLGNALVDLLFECSEAEFQSLNKEKGSMTLVSQEEQKILLSKLGTPVRMASGGSVANSVASIGQLGGRAALLCSVADDSHGKFFIQDLLELGVEV